MRKLWIAADHAGFELKQQLVAHFKSLGVFEVIDLGTSSKESVDYPDYANLVCENLQHSNATDGVGILICGSGQGMAIRANKHPGIRAALCWNTEIAQLSRAHNNANILCMGSRFVSLDLAIKISKAFLDTAFEGGRHQIRVEKIG